MELKRPVDKVRESLMKVKTAYGDLVWKHDEFILVIEDVEQFETEEVWLEECQEKSLNWEHWAMDYIAEFNTKKNGSDDWPEVIDQAEVVEIGGQLNENSKMNDKSSTTGNISHNQAKRATIQQGMHVRSK